MRRDATNASGKFIFAEVGDCGIADIIKVGADFGLNADTTNTMIRSIKKAKKVEKLLSCVAALSPVTPENCLRNLKNFEKIIHRDYFIDVYGVALVR